MLIGTFAGLFDEPIYAMKYVVCVDHVFWSSFWFYVLIFWWSFDQVFIAFSNIVNGASIAMFKNMATAKLSGNTVVDGGLDLNMEGGMAE